VGEGGGVSVGGSVNVGVGIAVSVGGGVAVGTGVWVAVGVGGGAKNGSESHAPRVRAKIARAITRESFFILTSLALIVSKKGAKNPNFFRVFRAFSPLSCSRTL